MLVVGLTGGIGSGKSTIANLFAKRDVPIIDADVIARKMVEPGESALHEIISAFGEDVIDRQGQLDRKLLRKRVFNNAAEREKLEQILHPRIRRSIVDQLEQIDAPYCLLVIPLLIDTGEWQNVDRILVVDADEETQITRVMQRDNQSREQVMSILDAQVSRESRLESADDIIANNGSLDELDHEVEQLHQYYLSLDKTEKISPLKSQAANTQSNHIVYEQPLNERIRTFLKLESLFEKVNYHCQLNSKWDAQAVVNTLIEIANITTRGDLKSEIIKEIERQHASIKRHQNLPGVNQQYLISLLDQQQHILDQLHAINHPISQHLNTDSLFLIVKQRITLPGGASDFDIPAYSHWINLPDEIRRKQYDIWLIPYAPIEQAICTALQIIRDSADPIEKVAENGFYQQSMNAQKESQLIRVITELDQNYYPEISAGKHRFSVRFFSQNPNQTRPQQCQRDIKFTLVTCGI